MKEVIYAKGQEKRPEREVWEWEGREMELTTRLERLHLNKRRQRARPAKERKEMRMRKDLEGREKEARRIAEEQIRVEEAGKRATKGLVPVEVLS